MWYSFWKDVPCTCTLQFLVRGGRLLMFTNMRSNDVFIGLPHDIFAFTMIQEIVARALKLEPGTYSHAVGSLHWENASTSQRKRPGRLEGQGEMLLPIAGKKGRLATAKPGERASARQQNAG